MKKKISLLTALFAMMVTFLSSCGGNSENYEGLTPEERDAVNYVKHHLERKEKLIEFEIARGPMPAELMTDAFKKYRDGVNKAGMDFNSCQVRGIESGMQKALEKIAEAQNEIVTKCDQWRIEQGTSEFLFVLATYRTAGNPQPGTAKLIAAFNPVTHQNDFMLHLTKPVVNNAAMIYNALNGTLFEYATNQSEDLKTLASKVENPVIKFIFETDPSTVR